MFRYLRGINPTPREIKSVRTRVSCSADVAPQEYTPRVDARFAAWVTTIAVNTVGGGGAAARAHGHQ